MSTKNIVIDASVSAIEEYINTFDRIIADLEGENGLKQFEAVDREINNNLDGEYKDAFSDSVLEAKMSYLDSIANVYALRTVLQIYANFLNNGSGGKLTSTSDKKKVDMKSIYNQINKLEEAFESRGLVKSVLKNDDYFASWYRGYENSLNDSFFHTYTVDSYGNLIDDGLFAQRSHNEAVFKNNREVYKDLVSTLDYGLASTSSLVTELQAISGILSGQLSNFDQIWDVFEFTKSDYQNYLIAHYDGITRSNIEEQINYIDKTGQNLEGLTEEGMTRIFGVKVNGNEVNFGISVVDGKVSHLRVDTTNLKSKEDCFIVINEILTVIRLEFPTYPVGDENIDTYEYMGNEKLCVAIWNDTYENVVSELWGHARLRHLEIPLDWLDEKLHEKLDYKADEADINKSDQIDDSEFEKDIITLFGGGDINLHGDGPKREGGEYV